MKSKECARYRLDMPLINKLLILSVRTVQFPNKNYLERNLPTKYLNFTQSCDLCLFFSFFNTRGKEKVYYSAKYREQSLP